MRVLIRADASSAIGSGHVARCLTLAKVLRKHGAQVTFVCRQLPGHLLHHLTEQGFVAHALPADDPQEQSDADIEALLPWQADIAALGEVLKDAPRFDWLIVDHYGLDARWESAARQFAEQLMAIDDLANRPHAVDLLLDQNYAAQVQDNPYARWLDNHCKIFLGPRFALLRDEFQSQPIDIKPRVEQVLVNFGGYDAARQVYATLLALQGLDDVQVDFVAGLNHPDWEVMSERIKACPNWRLHSLSSDFYSLMQRADLFIGAGGGTTWERAALGLPTICISVAANQQLNAQLLARAGVHLYLGAHQTLDPQRLVQAIGLLRENRELRQSFAERGRALVDGQGAYRLAAAMMAPTLQLRQAGKQDMALLFEGRNAAHVRRWAFYPELIDWDSHVSWFQRSLGNAQRLMLIGETAQGPIGVVRYDRDGECVEISIYLCEGQTGIGWGPALLSSGERFLRRHWPEVRCIQARVLAGNEVSTTLFLKAGYTQSDRHFQRVISDE